MSDAERSIAVKRKVGVTRPMSRDQSPAETYSPKRRHEGPQHEDTPPPYIPSKKESSVAGRAPAQRGSNARLSHHDARHVLNREERKELISRSRRRELLRTIGIDRSEEEEDRPKFEHLREVKSEEMTDEVKDFTITARVSPAPSRSRESQLKPEHTSRRSPSPPLLRKHSIPLPRGKTKGSISSRLGVKVLVVEKSPMSLTSVSAAERKSANSVRARVEKSSGNTRVRRAREGGERLALSRFGRDLVKKQCEAAVLSVTTASQPRASDSRVVHCDIEETREEEGRRARSTSSDRATATAVVKSLPVATSRKTDERVLSSSPKSIDDAEDLADMLRDSGSEPQEEEDLAADEFTLDLEEEDLSHVLEREADEARRQLDQQGGVGAGGGKKGTRFIVTLDGVDEHNYEESQLRQSSEYLGVGVRYPVLDQALPPHPRPVLGQQTLVKQYSPTGAVVPTAAVQAKMAPPKIQPFSINLKDSDDEHENKLDPLVPTGHVTAYQHDEPAYTEATQAPGLTALQKAKQNERCRFWPACATGTQCEYHHPTVHCKTFPNCMFGDKCLFIHPNCRFDSKCMRPDCPYTHSSKRTGGGPAHIVAIPHGQLVALAQPAKSVFRPPPPAPPSTSSGTVCRFFPNCLNTNCPFAHPKACHFGANCLAPGCPFYHPDKVTPPPSKDKLKWQAPPQVSAASGKPAGTKSA